MKIVQPHGGLRHAANAEGKATCGSKLNYSKVDRFEEGEVTCAQCLKAIKALRAYEDYRARRTIR